VIAKLDATANDFPPEFAVSGYPTLYWKSATSTTPEKYQGGREVKVSSTPRPQFLPHVKCPRLLPSKG
jgi:hypothetical protein